MGVGSCGNSGNLTEISGRISTENNISALEYCASDSRDVEMDAGFW